MGTEATGFEPGPELDLTAHAEAEQLRERLYAAQNALVRLENERAGIAADLQVVLRGQEWRMLNGTGEFRQAFEGLLDVAWPRSGARRAVAPSDGQAPEGAGVTEALSAARLEPCQRCNGSGSEPARDPDEAAGLALVARDDLRLAVSALRDLAGHAAEPLGDFARRLADAAGEAQPS
jgi:hypothetical protein